MDGGGVVYVTSLDEVWALRRPDRIGSKLEDCLVWNTPFAHAEQRVSLGEMDQIIPNSDGTMMFCVSEGHLRGLETKTGKIIWSKELMVYRRVGYMKYEHHGRGGSERFVELDPHSFEHVTTDLVDVLYIAKLDLVVVAAHDSFFVFSAMTGVFVASGMATAVEDREWHYNRSFSMLACEIRGDVHLIAFDGWYLAGINLSALLEANDTWKREHATMDNSLQFGYDWKWKEATHVGGMFAQPRERLMGGALVASGDTLALCCRGKIIFFSASTGISLSEIHFPGTSFKAGSPSTVLLEGDAIFARYRNTLMCCDIRTRVLIWSSNKVSSGHFCSMASFDGHLLISFGPLIALFNKDNGEAIWKKLIRFSSTPHEHSFNPMMTCLKVDTNTAVLSGLHCVLWIDAMSGDLKASVSLGEIPKIRYAFRQGHIIHWPAVSNVATFGSYSDNNSSTLRGAMVRMRLNVFKRFIVPAFTLALTGVGFIGFLPFWPGLNEAASVTDASNSGVLTLPDDQAAIAWTATKKGRKPEKQLRSLGKDHTSMLEYGLALPDSSPDTLPVSQHPGVVGGEVLVCGSDGMYYRPKIDESSCSVTEGGKMPLDTPFENLALSATPSTENLKESDVVGAVTSSTWFIYLADAVAGTGLATIDGYDVGYVSPGTSVVIHGIPVGNHVLTVFPTETAKTQAAPKRISISFGAYSTEYFTWNEEFQVIPGTREAQQATSLEAAVSYREISGIAFCEEVSVLEATCASKKAIIVAIHHTKSLFFMHPLKLEINGHLMEVLKEGEGVRVEVDPGAVTLDSYHNTAFMVPKDGHWKTSRTLIVEAGKTYYVNVKPFSGLIYLHTKMVDCEPDMAVGCHIKHVHLE